ncbi:MAG TPA: sensor histidine kinase, partial [Anaerolineales bacterium]|nr:sensor histidine kinase [Anaerolineales bacterium]
VFLAAALRSGHADWLAHLDSQARYLLAVPGAALAALALQRRSLVARREGRVQIARMFSLTAVGFGLYSISQLFVPRLDVFPANLVNAAAFQAAFGFPVQLVRAFLALGMTFSLIRAAQIAEKERQQAFFDIQQARLEALEAMRHEMDSREALRRELLRHTVIAQEDERARIARELHDETAQVLTAFSLILATFRNTLGDDAAANDLVGRLQGLCRQMSQGIYRLVHDLRPAQLDDLGLVAALQHLADMEQKRIGLAVDLSVIGQRRRLDPLVETVFFRVAQEALTNVARHADVAEAQIELVFGENQVQLQVHDDGCGFDPSSNLVPPHGWGLAGMRERAESIGGTLELTSAPSQGTTVMVRAPLGEAVGNYREGRENGYYSINVS